MEPKKIKKKKVIIKCVSKGTWYSLRSKGSYV